MGPGLGQSGLARFGRDVLSQAGVRYVVLALGINDILFPGSFIPPFEDALFRNPSITAFSTPKHERVRQEVNAWIRTSREFDAVVDLDAVVRDPSHPARLLPAYDSGDHLHVNDAANVAQADASPLKLFAHG